MPRDEGKALIYVCGPTVYDEPHLGHARAAVVFDLLRQLLAYSGYRVLYVQNYTDVDDKIIARAAEEDRSPWEVAEAYARLYDDAMKALGVRPPDIGPRATAHIAEMVALIKTLIEKGHAYPAEGNVYFSVASFPAYGRLSGRNVDELLVGGRVEPGPGKRHPLDFALWKAARAGEPSWESPWGPGRPGWHIECSAMSLKYLGPGFDIHGGGEDLIFPHHENEIAQSEAATGRAPFARYWVHNGLVNLGPGKMAKTGRNYVLVREALDRYPPQALRLFLLSAHYRAPLDFHPEALEETVAAYRRVASFWRRAEEELGVTERAGGAAEGRGLGTGRPRGALDSFYQALEDDLDTPAARAFIFEAVLEGNRALDAGRLGVAEEAFTAVREAASFLGLAPARSRAEPLLRSLVELVLELREEARRNREFDRADALRARLKAVGVMVEDTPSGPRWRLEEAVGGGDPRGGGDLRQEAGP